jgi:hypothetical protein
MTQTLREKAIAIHYKNKKINMKKIAEPILKYKIEKVNYNNKSDIPKITKQNIYYGDNENQTHSEQSFNAKGGRDYSNFQLGKSYKDMMKSQENQPLSDGYTTEAPRLTEAEILRLTKLKSGKTPLEIHELLNRTHEYPKNASGLIQLFNAPIHAERKEYEENIPSGDIENTPPIFPTLVQGGFVTFDPFTARQEKTKHLVTGIGPLAKKINFKDIYRNTQSKKESPEPFVYDGEKTEHKDPNWDTHGDAPRDIIKSQQAYLKAMNS